MLNFQKSLLERLHYKINTHVFYTMRYGQRRFTVFLPVFQFSSGTVYRRKVIFRTSAVAGCTCTPSHEKSIKANRKENWCLECLARLKFEPKSPEFQVKRFTVTLLTPFIKSTPSPNISIFSGLD